MKNRCACLFSALVIAGLSVGLSAQAALTGQWDFSGDLSATVGNPLEYRGDTATYTTFSTVLIGGQSAEVMYFPATTPTQGYTMTHGAAANGGGSYVNQYTLVMDIMFPAASSGVYRSLWQTSTGNANDGDLFVDPSNGIGISGAYQGVIQPDVWYRVAFAFDLTTSTLGKYIDGALVNQQTLSSGVDGRWSLDPTALVFTDEDGETASGYVNSLQIYDSTLTAADILALGGPTAAGLPVPEPSSVVMLVGGGSLLALLMLRRQRKSIAARVH